MKPAKDHSFHRLRERGTRISRARICALASLAALLFARGTNAGYYNLGAFWQNSCGRSVKLVQSAGPSYANADSESVALPSSETAGDLLVAVVSAHSYSENAFEYLLNAVVTDSAGNTWYSGPVWNNNYSNPIVQFWYAPNVQAGANTVTATLLPTDPSSADTGLQLSVVEYSGIATTDVVDIAQAQLGASVGATQSVSAGTMTTGTSCDLVVAAVSDEQDYTATIGAGWRKEASNTTEISLYLVDNLPSGAINGTKVDASATLSQSDNNWVVGEMAFRAASTTAPAQPTKLAFTTASQSDSTWACSSAVTVTAENSSGTATNTSTGLTVALTGSTSYSTPSLIQSQSSTTQEPGSTASQSVAVTATGSGHLLVVGVTYSLGDGPITSVTDNAGDTFVSAGALSVNADGGSANEIWYAANSIAGATSVTVNLPIASGNFDVWFQEYSGTNTSSPLDAEGITNAGSMTTTYAAPTVQTSQPNDIVISVGNPTSSAASVQSPFTDLTQYNGTEMAYDITASQGTYGAVWNSTGSGTYNASTAAFKALSSGVTYYSDPQCQYPIPSSPYYYPDYNGLVGWWQFNDGTGSSATDSSGNGNTGRLKNSPIWQPGNIGEALSFDGENQYVSVADSSALELSASWTVSVWVNPVSLPVEGQSVKIVSRTNAAGENNYDLTIDNRNHCSGLGWNVHFTDTSGNDFVACDVTSISTGTWTLLTGEWNSSTSTLSLYLNGTLVATQNESGHAPASGSGGSLAIGTDPSLGVGWYFSPFLDGIVDDVRVYDRLLTAGEIQDIYLAETLSRPSVVIGAGTSSATYYFESGSTTDNTVTASDSSLTSNLVGWWKFDEGNGTTAADSSGNGNTGTLVNSPTWTTAGVINDALIFGGSAYVDAGDATSLQVTGSLTMSAWIYMTSVNPNDADDDIIDKNDWNTPSNGFQLKGSQDCTGPNNGDNLVLNISSSSTVIERCSNTVLQTNTWYFVAGVYNASAQTMDVYVNGNLDSGAWMGGDSSVPPAINNSIAHLAIGQSIAQGSFVNFHGTIDDVRVYNAALSQAQIVDIMNDRELASVSQTETVSAAPHTWIGSGNTCTASPHNWSNADCWSDRTVPSSSVVAHFDGSCVNCSPNITGNIDVGGIWMHSDYAGTISPSANGNYSLTTENSFEEDGGTFLGSTASYATSFLDKGNFTLTGGSFTAPASTGSFMLNGATASSELDMTISGSPTFIANGGLLDIGGSSGAGTLAYGVPINISPGTAQFNNVSFTSLNANGISIAGTMQIAGTLTINQNAGAYGGYFNSGTLAVSGNVNAESGNTFSPNDSTTATLLIDGSGNQTITSVATGGLPTNVVIDSSGGTVTFSGTIDQLSSWTYESGTVAMSGSTVNFADGSAYGVPATIDSGSMSFGNVQILPGDANPTDITGTMNVGGNLTLGGNSGTYGGTVNSGTISLAGNLSVSGGNGGSAGIAFTGSGTQTITQTGGTLPSGPITVNDGGIAEVQTTPGAEGGSPLSVSFSSLPVPGDAIVVYVTECTGGGGVWSFATGDITDNQGNSYYLAASNVMLFSSIYCGSAIFYSTGISTPTGTFTITNASNPTSSTMVAVEYSGIASTGALDQTANNSGSSASASSGTTAATSQASELVTAALAFNCNTGTCTASVPTGYTGRFTEGASAYNDLQASDMVISSTGAQSATWTTGGAGNSPPTYAAAIATFKGRAAAGTVQLASNLALSSGQALNVSSGTLDLNGYNLTGSPALAVTGTLKLVGNETTTLSSFTANTGSTVYYYSPGTAYTLQSSPSPWTYYNLTIAGNAPLYTLPGATTVNGNLNMSSGAIDVTTNNYGLTIGGNYSQSGARPANYRNGTVTFASGASHSISPGASDFYNLKMDDSGNTASDTLTFQHSSTTMVTGTLTLKGNTSHNLKLRSDSTGTQWNIDPSGTRTLSYIDVEDSDNMNATAIDAGTDWINSGNNTNWTFGYATPTLVQSTSKACTTNVRTCSKAFASNNTAGNTVIVGFKLNAAACSSISGLSVSDNDSNTYAIDVTESLATAAQCVGLAHASNISTSSNNPLTVTVSYSSTSTAGHIELAIEEYSGLAATSAFDQYAVNNASSASLSSNDTPTTTQANELLIGVFGLSESSSEAMTLGGTYSNGVTVTGTKTSLYLEDSTVTNTGIYGATCTMGTSEEYAGIIGTYKAGGN